jgi:hypothetical protein
MWEGVKRILRAYAAHDAATGYVQSMNFISAFLLLAGLSEEDAFWCLVALVSRVVPGYFSEGMSAAKLDARVLRALLHVHLPALALHVDELSAAAGDEHLITSIIAGQWLLTLYVNVLPATAVSGVWDELARAAHRAPLFAAALSLLAGAQAEVCATAEMGEALELLQGLGARALVQPGACEAFVERLRGYARGPLSPDALAAACARELGEGGPEAGLGSFLTGGRLAGKGAGAGAGPGAGPGGPPGYAAATDASELLRGLVSGGLYALAHSRGGAESSDDGDGGLQAELAAVQCLEGGTPKAGATASFGAVAGPGLQPGAGSAAGALSAEDVLRLSDALVRLERSLRDAPWLRAAARDAVRARVLRPLGALAGARLARARADLSELADAFAADVNGVLAARGLSGLDTHRPTYLAMWDHGSGEAALAAAERLLDRLGRARQGWRALAHAVAADDAGAASGTPTGSPVPFGTPGEPGSPAAAITVCEATVQAAAAAHAVTAAAALTAMRTQLARRMAAAAEDLPRLAANEAEVGAFLEARRQTALRGAVEWMTIWDARRVADANATTDSLLASAAAAADALQGGPLPEPAAPPASPPPPPPPPEAPPEAAVTLDGFETEAARCGGALAALAQAQRNLTRRRERLGREAALVRAVRERAARRVADAAARAESMHNAAARCTAHLRALAAPTAPAAADAVCARIEELQATALAVVSASMCDSADFLADATTAALMSYVTLIDRCTEDMSALSEQMAATLRMERDREAQKITLPSGREVLSVVGTTISKAVNNVGAPAIAAAGALAGAMSGGGGNESGDEDAGSGSARAAGHRAPARGGPAAGAGFIAGALRRGLAAAARGFDVPRGELDGEDSATEHPRSQPASPQQRRHADGPLPPTPSGGGAVAWLLDAPGPPEEVVYDTEGRPRRKGRSERALEQEMQVLAEKRAELLARKEAFTAMLRRGAAGGGKRPGGDAEAAAPAAAGASGDVTGGEKQADGGAEPAPAADASTDAA